MRSLAAVALALGVAMAAPADARPHHHHHHHHRPASVATAPCFLFGCLTHRAGAAVTHAGAISGRPAACAGIAWCGCWLRLHLGVGDARLNVARAWASVGTDAGGPASGVVAVWRHHVGLITENLGGGMIRLLSGNDGGAVRERVISTRALGGVIAYRKV